MKLVADSVFELLLNCVVRVPGVLFDGGLILSSRSVFEFEIMQSWLGGLCVQIISSCRVRSLGVCLRVSGRGCEHDGWLHATCWRLSCRVCLLGVWLM